MPCRSSTTIDATPIFLSVEVFAVGTAQHRADEKRMPGEFGHHPHVAQGMSFHGESLLIHSLGNLCFDQERLETMLGETPEIQVLIDSVRASERGIVR